MKQNTISLDFLRSWKVGYSNTFLFNVEKSLDASTGITLQNISFNGFEAIAVSGLYVPEQKRIYASLINGYWTVDGRTVTFVKGPNYSLDSIYEYLRNTVQYRVTSGNPIIINDGYPVSIRALSVTLTPKQNGTPSVESPVAITGATSVSVTRTGKNMVDTKVDTATNNGVTIIKNADGSISISGTATRLTFFNLTEFVWPSGSYVASASGLNDTGYYAQVYYIEPGYGNRYIGTLNRTNLATVIDVRPEYGMIYTRFVVNEGAVIDDTVFLQVERGTVATEFESPHVTTVTVSLVDANDDPLTVYGGTLDVTNGELTVTYDSIDSYDGETVPDGWLSSTGELSTGAQVVYPLAPADYQTYNLTEQSLSMLSGYNVISTPAESLSVEYRSDPLLGLDG